MDKAATLLKLAKDKFGDTLTKAEIKLLDKLVGPELADYSNDEDRKLQAKIIEWLCSDKEAITLVTHRGVCVKGAHIDGSINLAYLDIPFPLYFEKCNIAEQIELHGAKLRELYLGGCNIGPLSADGAKFGGNLFLRDGFKAEGEVNLIGATIEGDFDCSNGHFSHPSGKAINLSRARVRNNVLFIDGFKSNGAVTMVDSHIEGNLLCNGGEFINSGEQKTAINASRLKCRGDVCLKRGFRAEGEVTFSGGSVGGSFECLDGNFCNHNGDALNAEALNVGGGIFLMSNFKGEVRLLGATVGQSLECHGGNFDNPNGYAINADSVNIVKNVFFRDAFKANGEINLIGAKIGGDIDCENGYFINPDAIAIHADEIEVGGSIYLRHGFRAEGTVILVGGRITSGFDCEYGQFTNKINAAIWAEGLNVGGSVLLCSRYVDDQINDSMPKQFRAEGGVSFRRAVIGGAFDCQGSQFINNNGCALVCSGIKVNDNVYLCNSSKTVKQKEGTVLSYQVFRAEGQVDFSGARIGGSLSCYGGEFVNKRKDGSVNKGENEALNLDCIEINDSIILSNNFHAEGTVSLLGAKIGGQLNCIDGQFINPDGTAFIAESAIIYGNVFLCGSDFNKGEKEKASENKVKIEGKILLSGAEIKGCFVWCKVASPEKVYLDLQCAQIGSLWDEKKSWPEKGKLLLHGLIYNEIYDKAPRDAKTRKEWLSRQPKFTPQPYEQLAKVLKDDGHKSDAEKILIEKEKKITWLSGFSLWRMFWRGISGITIGYGYQPWRALWFIGFFILIGYGIFGSGYKTGVIVPVEKDAYIYEQGGQLREGYPKFNAFVYSIEMFVPVVDLRMAKYWMPDATKAEMLSFRKYNIPIRGDFIRGYMWIHICAGWILTTLLVVGLTGLVKK